MLDAGLILDDAARRRLTDRFGAAAGPWFAALPGLVNRCCRRWDLDLDGAASGSTSRVFTGSRRDGRRVVLKLTPEPAIAAGEALALAAWAGTPHAVDLLDADPEAGALLLEELHPGTGVSSWPALPTLPAVARMLAALRAAPLPAAGRLPAQADRLEFVFSLFARRLDHPRAAASVTPALLERGRRAALRLAASGPAALVHGDLHPGNVLDGGPGRGLVAIDPRPCVGDPDADAADWAFTRAGSASEVQDRIGRLAALVPGLDAGRVWRWCTAFAVLAAIAQLRQHEPGTATGMLLSLAEQA